MRPGAVEPLRPELPVAAPAHVVHLVVREAVGRPAPVRLPALPKCHAQPVQLKAGVLAHRNDPQRLNGGVVGGGAAGQALARCRAQATHPPPHHTTNMP